MITNDKPSDPAEKGVNHHAGYGNQYDRILAAAKNGYTLAAGEGEVLARKIEELQNTITNIDVLRSNAEAEIIQLQRVIYEASNRFMLNEAQNG